jgi:hypothetical protein
MTAQTTFASLGDAVDHVAALLDSRSFDVLAESVGAVDTPVAPGLPTDRDYCLRAISLLAMTHEKTDLRDLYRGREFPQDVDKFKLGGHASELGHIHIDFVRQEDGWRINRIWQCR